MESEKLRKDMEMTARTQGCITKRQVEVYMPIECNRSQFNYNNIV